MQFHPIRRGEGPEPLRPLDHGDARSERLLQTEFGGIIGRFEAIEVEMPEFACRTIVGLDEGVGRTGRLVALARPRADEAARQCRLTCAEVPEQQERIADDKLSSELGAQRLGGGDVR